MNLLIETDQKSQSKTEMKENNKEKEAASTKNTSEEDEQHSGEPDDIEAIELHESVAVDH